MSKAIESNINEEINAAGDGSGVALPPAFVIVQPRVHRRMKKNNGDKVDGRTSGAKALFTRIQKRKMKGLSFSNHDRDYENFKYVYPVLSRRSDGISVGINLNVNNTCNWRCIYCQVPNLKRGKPNKVNLFLLEIELDSLITDIISKKFNKSISSDKRPKNFLGNFDLDDDVSKIVDNDIEDEFIRDLVKKIENKNDNEELGDFNMTEMLNDYLSAKYKGNRVKK